MKNIRLFGILFLSALMMASCAGIAHIEKDETANFSNYKTYSWIETQESQDSVKTKVSDLTERTITKAVNNELAKAGYRESKQEPDLLLSYDVLVERSSKEETNPIYSRPYTRYYYNPYNGRLQTLYYPSQFLGYERNEYDVREGTITISIIEAKTDKTIWQGWTTDEVNSRNLSAKEIEAAVKNIFRKFDVAKN